MRLTCLWELYTLPVKNALVLSINDTFVNAHLMLLLQTRPGMELFVSGEIGIHAFPNVVHCKAQK